MRRCLASKLVGTGAVGSQGISLALSTESNTAILGGRNDILAPEGAAWLFVQPVATVPFFTFSAQLEIAPWPDSKP
jgi:hypothetical protein